jgi:hypothetical protein
MAEKKAALLVHERADMLVANLAVHWVVLMDPLLVDSKADSTGRQSVGRMVDVRAAKKAH